MKIGRLNINLKWIKIKPFGFLKRDPLGPKQREWVNALRSGNYPQGQSVLCRLQEDGKATGYCCLGVACEMFEFDKQLKFNAGCIEYSAPEGLREEDADGKASTLVMPGKSHQLLGLRSSGGGFSDDYKGTGDTSLAEMNDNGLDFAGIADFIEAHPSIVFKTRV